MTELVGADAAILYIMGQSNAADCPFYDQKEPFFGIFAPDNVHYLAKTQHWFSDLLLKRFGITT